MWRRQRGGSGDRLIERVSGLKRLGLRDVQALEKPAGTPDGIELGSARFDDRLLALVASRRDGLDLLGWARVAAFLVDREDPPRELIVAAPVVSARTRRAAERARLSGAAPLLVSVPALAPSADEVFESSDLEALDRMGLDAGSSVLGRVVRVLEGATAVTSAGGVRPTASGYVVYLRGERVGLIHREGDGVTVTMLRPDRHRIQITDASFARWGPDLHELIVELARDPRLIDAEQTAGSRALERAALDEGVRVTARWIPWSDEGEDPLDWAGVDARGRPLLGTGATSLGLGGVPRLLAGLDLLEDERDLWVPGSVGPARLALACARVERDAQTLLAPFLMSLDTTGVSEQPDEPRARRGRRRSRRRRRERPEQGAPEAALESEDTEEEPAERDAAFRAVTEREDEDDEEQEAETREGREPEAEPQRTEGRRRSRSRRSRGRRGRSGEPDVAAPERSVELAASDEEEWPEPDARPDGPDEPDEPPMEAEAEPLAESAAAEEEAVEPEAEVEVEPVRRRQSRAALIVRDDPDCILAALVLGRERRSVVSFRVCAQGGLMDFFRGPATDIGENTDVVLVGFGCRPKPIDTLNTAELFRGRLEWFDHHLWAPEDLERLRLAIGDDAVFVTEGAASPLPEILRICERRSRFTDKLVELAGRRLSEVDMEKWGYRLIGLIDRMVASPGEYRSEISPVLSGKPGELPKVDAVYTEEAGWLEQHDPRIVHFGEYQMAVVRVPGNLDAGEVGRRARLTTGARLSLASREGEDLLMIGCNEEKRPVNVVGLADQVGDRIPWAHVKPGGDRVGRIVVDDLESHPERVDSLISEIARNRSVLYG